MPTCALYDLSLIPLDVVHVTCYCVKGAIAAIRKRDRDREGERRKLNVFLIACRMVSSSLLQPCIYTWNNIKICYN